MDDEALRRLAMEWLDDEACDYCADKRLAKDARLALLLRRVATEAARLERERIEGIVRLVRKGPDADLDSSGHPPWFYAQARAEVDALDRLLRRIAASDPLPADVLRRINGGE